MTNATVQSLREQLSALRLKYGNYGGPMGELFDLAYKMAHALNAAHSTVESTTNAAPQGSVEIGGGTPSVSPEAPAAVAPSSTECSEPLLSTIEQAFAEMSHAHSDPNWFTKGHAGAHAQFRLWLDRGLEALKKLRSLPSATRVESGPLKLDTDAQVFFYEQDHYYLSNFSAFTLRWCDIDFPTSEHAYHWYRFNGVANMHQAAILASRSAHDAFRYAQANKAHQRPEWDEVKVGVMREILRAKARQHEYVRRKLLQTGERELVENSWRDSFWGWGEDRRGQNMLGKLWMEIRAELRASSTRSEIK